MLLTLLTTCTTQSTAAPMMMLDKALPWTLAVSAAARRGKAPMFDIILYSSLIAAGVIVLVFVALKVRHWLLDNSEESGSGDFFSISQLRQLRDNGSLSDEEFERAKRVLIAQGLSMLRSAHGDD